MGEKSLADSDGADAESQAQTGPIATLHMGGRPEALGPRGREEDDDRLELRALGAGAYGVFAYGANGQIQFTDFGGGIADLDEPLRGPLLHLLRRWTAPKPHGRRGTSGTSH